MAYTVYCVLFLKSGLQLIIFLSSCFPSNSLNDSLALSV